MIDTEIIETLEAEVARLRDLNESLLNCMSRMVDMADRRTDGKFIRAMDRELSQVIRRAEGVE